MEQIHKKPQISVLIPAYNNASTIGETIKSILKQSHSNFELVIRDDKSTDNTVKLIKSFNDNRLKLYLNEKNLGCGGNINACVNMATADILVYVCGDDILDSDALKKIYEAFQLSDKIGIVVRPYYWFERDFRKPVRVTRQFYQMEMVSIDSSFDKIRNVIALSDQLSGIGFKKEYLTESFEKDPFIETASMVIRVLKNNKAVILKDNIVAVRIGSGGSNTRAVYKKSPMLSWFNLINKVFVEENFAPLRKYLVKNFIANNYIGLIQIKIYGSYKFLLREILYLLKFRWQNVFSFNFWFFAVGTIFVPRFILKDLVVFFKDKINSKLIKIMCING